MEIGPRGWVRPVWERGSAAASSERILSACPGANLRGPGKGPGIHPVWGPVLELRRTWAADPAIRHHAAAGGTLTALATFLLDRGDVEAIVQVRASTERPMISDAVVSTTAAEVYAGAQSRYGPVAPLVHVNRLLDEGKRFAVAAKPCDISAMRNLARSDPRVEEQVPYLLTIFCGGMPSTRTPEAISAHHGLDPDQVALFRWRGEGWPGPTRVVSQAGETFDMPYTETWEDRWPWMRPLDLQWRCKICPDAIGEGADIACPDGWILKDGARLREEADGVNAAIARTPRGRALLSEAIAAGYLESAPLTFEELAEMHFDHLPRKLGHPARRIGMAIAGEPTPRFSGYRSLTAMRKAGLKSTVQTVLGTIRRVRAGRNRETLETGKA